MRGVALAILCVGDSIYFGLRPERMESTVNVVFSAFIGLACLICIAAGW